MRLLFTSRLEFTVSLAASSANVVEVLIGTDANGDGLLSLDETDCTVGCRCGKCFRRDAVGDGRVVMAHGLKRGFVLEVR